MSVLNSPEEILEGTSAARFLDADMLREAERLVATQERVVRDCFSEPSAPPAEVAAELGLSIQTLNDVRSYAQYLEDWRLEGLLNVLRGGDINEDQIDYQIAPVAF